MTQGPLNWANHQSDYTYDTSRGACERHSLFASLVLFLPLVRMAGEDTLSGGASQHSKFVYAVFRSAHVWIASWAKRVVSALAMAGSSSGKAPRSGACAVKNGL